MSQENRPGAVEELTELYREIILRHATHPTGFQADIEVTHECEKYNPLCGDRINVQLQINGDEVEATAFTGQACAICMAAASLLCEQLAGQKTTAICAGHDWLCTELAEAGSGGEVDHKELRPLLGVRRYPSRIRCAVLPWEAACEAVTGS